MAFSHIASKTVAATVLLAGAGVVAATPEFADPQVLQFGQMAEISSNGGTIDYTVGNLQAQRPQRRHLILRRHGRVSDDLRRTRMR